MEVPNQLVEFSSTQSCQVFTLEQEFLGLNLTLPLLNYVILTGYLTTPLKIVHIYKNGETVSTSQDYNEGKGGYSC